MDKTDSGWSEPKDEVINTSAFEANATCAANGNLYFTSNRSGKNELYFSKWSNGKYSSPILLKEFSAYGFCEQYIAPDESYILFSPESNRKIYISFLKDDGSWSVPKDLGLKVNKSGISSNRPCISPDGNYLFFSQFVGDYSNPSIYQVDWRPLLDSLKNY